MNAWLDSSDSLWRLAGWTMIHFLWIGGLVAVAGGLLRLAARRASPGVRYALSLVALAALAATPAVIAARLALDAPAALALQPQPQPKITPAAPPTAPPAARPAPAPIAPPAPVPSAGPVVVDLAQRPPAPGPRPVPAAPAAATSPREAAPLRPAPAPTPWPSLDAAAAALPWLWLVGAPLTFCWLAAGLVGSERLRRHGATIAAGPALEACQRLRRAMHISRQVALAGCDSIAQPVLLGIVRPMILLPAAALSGWTPEELEMVLLHELAHVRRWDNLVNLLQRIVESLLFFHPAVWLASRQVRRDREECCDAAVVRHTARPEQYAELLVSIAASLRREPAPPLALASAMADHPLAGRIRRILKLPEEPMGVSRRTLAATLALPLLLIAITVYAADEGKKNPPPSQGGAGGGITPAAGAKQPAANQPAKKPDKEDKDIVYVVTYPVADIAVVDLQEWTKLIGAPRTEVQWFDPNKSIVIAATAEVHQQISAFLARHRNLAQAEVEERVLSSPLSLPPDQRRNAAPPPKSADSRLAELLDRIESLQKFLRQAHDQRDEVEQIRQLALDAPTSAKALDLLVAATLEQDATQYTYRQQCQALEQQLEQRRDPRGADSDNPSIRRLRALLDQTRRQADEHRAQLDADLREQFAAIDPVNLQKAVLEEHKRRDKQLRDETEGLQNDLLNAIDELKELSAAPQPPEAAGDSSTPPAADPPWTPPVAAQPLQAQQTPVAPQPAQSASPSPYPFPEPAPDDRDQPAADADAEPIPAPYAEELANLARNASQLEAEVAQTKQELAAIAAAKAKAIEGAASTEELDRLIEQELASDQQHQLQQKLVASLEEQLGNVPQSDDSKTHEQTEALRRELREAQARLLHHRQETELALRERLRKFPNDEIRQAVEQHNERLVDLQQSLRGLEKGLAQLKERRAIVTTVGNLERARARHGADDIVMQFAPDTELGYITGLTGRLEQAGHKVTLRKVDQDRYEIRVSFAPQPPPPSDPPTTPADAAPTAPPADATDSNPFASDAAPAAASTPPPARFPTLEEQRIIDRAYNMLGLELEPLGEDDLARVQQLGYAGGLMSTGRSTTVNDGEILVGLHVWPVVDLQSLDAILSRADLAELAPLKYYAVHQLHGQLKVRTGRIDVQRSSTAPQLDPGDERALQPGDQIHIQAAHTPQDAPLDADFIIEPGGTVPLGATYGRVAVAGKTVLEAEAAVEKHLSETLRNPETQLTLLSPQDPWQLADADGQLALATQDPVAGAETSVDLPRTAAPPAQPVHLYDGKTFDQWRESWQAELNVDRRLEAIEALAAFARVGRGREAAAAIFDVAGQYNFTDMASDPNLFGGVDRAPADRKLKSGVINLLAAGQAQVRAADWLPELLERLAGDPPKWKPLYEALLYQMRMNGALIHDAEATPLLLGAARDADYGVEAATLATLSIKKLDEQSADEVDQLLVQTLAGEDAAKAVELLRLIGFQATAFDRPAAIRLLLHNDPAISRAARTALTQSDRNARPSVVRPLLAVLDDPEQAAQHADALRALAVLNGFARLRESELASELTNRVIKLLEEGPAELIAPALTVLWPPDSIGVVEDDERMPGPLSPERRELIKQARQRYDEEWENLWDRPPHPAPTPGGGMF